MRIRYFLVLLFFVFACQQAPPSNDDTRTSVKSNEVLTKGIATSPSMGWMSSSNMDEKAIKKNADYLAVTLKPYGWDLVVLDMDWYSSVDSSGMPIVNPQRFPSSRNSGRGLKVLSDHLKSKGLKFGVSLSTGQAGLKKDLITLQKENPSFIKKLVQQLSDWGVNYLSIDGLTSPYDQATIQALQQATNQKMVLSLSGDATSLKEAQHVKRFANIWPVHTASINSWSTLKQAFSWARPWQLHIGNGHWASFGQLNIEKGNNTLIQEELKTYLTLNCLFRSPLMLTGSLEKLDDYTLSLLSNKEVYAVHQFAKNSEELYIAKYGIVWAAEDQQSNDRFVALFNTSEEPQSMRVDWATMGWNGTHQVKDLWNGEDLGHFEGTYFAVIPPHGAGLFRIYLD